MKRSAKRERPIQRQRGQFMTPPSVAAEIVTGLDLASTSKVLEPSFGTGSFLIALIERLMAMPGSDFRRVMLENVYGVELDPQLYRHATKAIEARWGPLPDGHNLQLRDYFRCVSEPPFTGFDVIVGNPPFGGTFDAHIEDELDRTYGRYGGHKLKKETYSFFTAKSIGELALDGRLCFICSDTFLTIKTMRGLRELLIDSGEATVTDIQAGAFAETSQPMVVLDLKRGPASDHATIRGHAIPRTAMALTQNFSWGLTPDQIPYFDGPTLGEFVVATGGMTIGKNEWFVRPIASDGTIEEPYEFEFVEEPITLEGERARARLQKLSSRLHQRAVEQEARGEARRAVRVRPLAKAKRLPATHPDYRLYNKATSDRLYAKPTHVVYWKNDGEAVLTFKKAGPWYLHGVGGKPYFGREGITWQLVAPRVNARYLPRGFVLDSGAPCAFLREGVSRRQLFIILGWLLTDQATTLLKTAINHTRNIQGKDLERLPYPHWVPEHDLFEIGALIEDAVTGALNGEPIKPDLGRRLNAMFALTSLADEGSPAARAAQSGPAKAAA